MNQKGENPKKAKTIIVQKKTATEIGENLEEKSNSWVCKEGKKTLSHAKWVHDKTSLNSCEDSVDPGGVQKGEGTATEKPELECSLERQQYLRGGGKTKNKKKRNKTTKPTNWSNQNGVSLGEKSDEAKPFKRETNSRKDSEQGTV